MEGMNRDQREGFIHRLNEMLKGRAGLFIAADDPGIEAYSSEIFNKLLDSGKINIEEIVDGSRQRKFREAEERAKADLVKASSLRHKEVREMGSEPLCYETVRKLKLDTFLSGLGLSKEATALALTQIVSRAVHPGSELSTARWIRERSAICQLSRYNPQKMTKDRLYRSALKLYEHKEALENHLSSWTRERFSFEDSIILYDLTNTYFEGAMRSSQLAQLGRSKEKRSDCKLLVLAMVINREGFPKHYSLVEENMSDSASLTHIIKALDAKQGMPVRKPTVVMDAGIATQANLSLLKEKGYPYLCVSRSRLMDYQVEEGAVPVQITDKQKQPIERLCVKSADNDDTYLWVRSRMKAVKEEQMKQQFCERFEAELSKIKASLGKKGGVKKTDKVNRRIGRAQQKYPSIQGWYDLHLRFGGEKNIVEDLTWAKNPEKENHRESGVYFLRTSLKHQDEATMWMIYNVIREVEYTFSVLKTDLDLRPIYYKSDEASLAHLHLGILAYWVAVTLRHQLKKKNIHTGWRQIVEIMDSHKWVESTMQTPESNEVTVKRCSEPNEQVKQIYLAVGVGTQPLKPEKSVRYQIDAQKKHASDREEINSS
jgi:transposase